MRRTLRSGSSAGQKPARQVARVADEEGDASCEVGELAWSRTRERGIEPGICGGIDTRQVVRHARQGPAQRAAHAAEPIHSAAWGDRCVASRRARPGAPVARREDGTTPSSALAGEHRCDLDRCQAQSTATTAADMNPALALDTPRDEFLPGRGLGSHCHSGSPGRHRRTLPPAPPPPRGPLDQPRFARSFASRSMK